MDGTVCAWGVETLEGPRPKRKWRDTLLLNGALITGGFVTAAFGFAAAIIATGAVSLLCGVSYLRVWDHQGVLTWVSASVLFGLGVLVAGFSRMFASLLGDGLF